MTLSISEFRRIGRFIQARRMAFTPAQHHASGKRRRHVAHVTQSELAEMVGVSTVVISQIEQGRYPNLNSSILKRITQALRLSSQQEMYVLGLLSPTPEAQKSYEPAPQWVVDSITETLHPVMVFNPAYDLVGWNTKVKEMFGEYGARFLEIGNPMIATFRMPELRTYFMNWEEFAGSIVSGLRMSYAVHPSMREYVTELGEELAAEDEFFRKHWEMDDPLVMPRVEKQFDHPSLGRLDMMQVVTLVVEAPQFTKVEFLPADDETRAKLASIES